jgi:hypothetical protein
MSAQADHGYKPATINRRLASITALYTFLSGEGVALVCPVRPKRHNVREPKRLPRAPERQIVRPGPNLTARIYRQARAAQVIRRQIVHRGPAARALHAIPLLLLSDGRQAQAENPARDCRIPCASNVTFEEECMSPCCLSQTGISACSAHHWKQEA